MNVLELPFNNLIGIQNADQPGYLLMLKDEQKYQNHLQTVHASAMFALAEATSGLFLQEQFRDINDVIPVVRSVDLKYRKPAYGCVYSDASFSDFDKPAMLEKIRNKQRLLITVNVILYDKENNKVMQADFEWFIAYK